jgi:hypothetical protein
VVSKQTTVCLFVFCQRPYSGLACFNILLEISLNQSLVFLTEASSLSTSVLLQHLEDVIHEGEAALEAGRSLISNL